MDFMGPSGLGVRDASLGREAGLLTRALVLRGGRAADSTLPRHVGKAPKPGDRARRPSMASRGRPDQGRAKRAGRQARAKAGVILAIVPSSN